MTTSRRWTAERTEEAADVETVGAPSETPMATGADLKQRERRVRRGGKASVRCGPFPQAPFGPACSHTPAARNEPILRPVQGGPATLRRLP